MSVDPATLAASILGASAVRTAPRSHPHHELPLVAPASREECVELVRAAASARIGIHVLGGGSALRGAPTSGHALILCTERLDRVLAHERDDLTFTAEAGLRVLRAQAGLRPHGQRLALAPRAEGSTLGGTVARAADGWTRKSTGFVRDQVLGIEVVTGAGKRITGGGRVVKNVSGFDLCRLFTGARASLGILLSLTFRLRSVPETRRVTRHAAADLAHAFSAARSIDQRIPDAEVLRVTRHEDGRASLLLSLAGARARVDAAIRSADDALPRGEVLAPEALEGTHHCVLRVDVQPAHTERASHVLAGLTRALRIDADIATGTIEAFSVEVQPFTEDERALLARGLSGLEALVDFPGDARAHLRREAAFGATPAEHYPVLQRLWRHFDPAGILEPGVHPWK